jgi:lambda family phage portal protein
MNWLDRTISWFSPGWALSREKSRAMARHYEAASFGRRTDGRNRSNSDANSAASGAALSVLRAQARDLVRNNPWGRQGLKAIHENTVGWGIRPLAEGPGAERMTALWKRWAESTECDSGGRQTFYGLQTMVMRTVAESGEVLIRRRFRRPEDGLAIPMQLQVLEPDLLDTSKDGVKGAAGGDIIQGVEFDMLGRRVAYWLFDRHPGGRWLTSPVSRRIPADGILHVFDQERPGQVRGPSWFASVDIRLRDFDEFEDATLMKQKIAACMAAFVTDLDGSGGGLGQPGVDAGSGQATDTFEPGMIIPLPTGKQVTVANPPSSTDHKSFTSTSLHGVAAGLGVTYEDLTGDYSQVNYSSARMARLAHQRKLHHWRWNMLIPQFCSPVWAWAVDVLALAGEQLDLAPVQWIAPPMPILEPDKEGTAYQRLIRNGAMTWPQMISELGEDPKAQLAAIAAFNKELDRTGVILDCDPRQMSQGGQPVTQPPPAPAPAASDEEDEQADGTAPRA